MDTEHDVPQYPQGCFSCYKPISCALQLRIERMMFASAAVKACSGSLRAAKKGRVFQSLLAIIFSPA